jgi:hypothetical protein
VTSVESERCPGNPDAGLATLEVAYRTALRARHDDGHLQLTQVRRRKRAMKIRYLVAILAVVSVVFMGTVGGVRAADEWFVLAEQPLKTTEGIVEIKSQGSRWTKDIKATKITVEGADVEIKKVILHWDNRKDETITNIGVLKSGTQADPRDAPGRKARLTMVSVQYKLQGGATAATVKVWGYD